MPIGYKNTCTPFILTTMRMKLIELEIVATIAWFVMDMFWMWQHTLLALLMFPVISISLVASRIKTKSKNVEKIIQVTFLWLTMNSLWMVSDLLTNNTYVLVIKIVATISGFLGLWLLIHYFLPKGDK